MEQRLHFGSALTVLCFVAMSVVAIARPHGILKLYTFQAESIQQWQLPKRLKEISGLALTSDERLLAVDDEVGIIYELDYDSGRIVKAFALGDPTVKADFEGIAVAQGLVYLTTSTGIVYSMAEAADGVRVTFDTFDTGVGDQCEIEGLTQSVDASSLYLLCKNVLRGSNIEGLSIFAWSVDNCAVLAEQTLLLPLEDIQRALRVDRFKPSGITIDTDTGNFIVIAARQHALVEISPEGTLIDAKVLPMAGRHRQAEGIELTSDGRLLIADEGGKHKARLAVYRQKESE